MGYNTNFEGEFELDEPLSDAQEEYLCRFADSRRLKLDPVKLQKRIDTGLYDKTALLHLQVGLPLGEDGAYFAGDPDESCIVGYNQPPADQPGLACPWTPTSDQTIGWDGQEKAQNYVSWIEYLIEHFLKRWELVLNGEVYWYGDDGVDDLGLIIVENNVVTVKSGRVVYE